MLCGIGLRKPFYHWLRSQPPSVECLEIIAEHFFDDRNHALLDEFASRYPVFVHGLGLSLGSDETLDPDDVARFSRVCSRANPMWVSEHVAFTRTADVDLGHLNPVSPSVTNAERIAEKARQLQDICGKPLLLENITTFLKLDGELSEPEFLNRICDLSGCRLLLDVTNLFINSRNHDFDALTWLHAVNPEYISQLHIVGYSQKGPRLQDSHAEPIQDDLWELFDEVERYGNVAAAIIERDASMGTAVTDLQSDLSRMKELVNG